MRRIGSEQSHQCFPIPSQATPGMAKKFGPKHVKAAAEPFRVEEKRHARGEDSPRLPLQAALDTIRKTTARGVGQGGSS